MSSKRWDKKEKEKLIKLFEEGKTYTEIAKSLDRSESAIRIRMQMIVYDFISKGISVANLSKVLNTNPDNIKQMFFAHRSFREGRGESVVPLDKTHELLKLDENINDNEKHDVSNMLNSHTKNKSKNTENSDYYDAHKIMEQNRIMEMIVNNHKLKKEIKQLHNQSKLSEEEKKMLEKVLTK